MKKKSAKKMTRKTRNRTTSIDLSAYEGMEGICCIAVGHGTPTEEDARKAVASFKRNLSRQGA